jgi:hypothetical protein
MTVVARYENTTMTVVAQVFTPAIPRSAGLQAYNS